ncbi:MAG: CmcJ/NvfI family oxidoreductase [Myxococcota bacterium]
MNTPRQRIARFNYLAAEVQSSLFRNGQVGLTRNPDGSDSDLHGLDLVEVELTVQDARVEPEAPMLDQRGFELLEQPLERPDFDFMDADAIARAHYPEVEAVVRDAVGASYAVAFDHNLRWAGGKKEKLRLDRGQEVQAPIQLTHGDYTLTSAPERLRQLSKPPSGNDTLRDILEDGRSALDPAHAAQAIRGERRFAIVNLWRNIAPEPVQSHPLGVCDAESVDPSDLVVFEIKYQDRIGENYFIKHAEGHRWYFYPHMTRDEPLLIKQWDSAGALARSQGEAGDGRLEGASSTFSIHSAFEDPETPAGAPDRRSLEVRCVVMWD